MITERPPNSCIKEWVAAHNPKRTTISSKTLEGMLKKETMSYQERLWSGDMFTGAYDYSRSPNRAAYMEGFNYVLSTYLPNVSSGLEFGCGSSASMYKMLPERLRGNWMMADISLDSVYVAKNVKNIGSKYFVASFHSMPIKDNSQEIIAGFNSFETTLHLNTLFEEVNRALHKGGYFFAIQDVIPNPVSTVLREYTENGKMDVIAHVTDNTDNDLTPILVEGKNGLIDARSYHHNTLRKIGQSLGMRLVFHGIIESSGVYPKHMDNSAKIDAVAGRYINMNEDKNSFCDIVSLLHSSKDEKIPKEHTSEKIAMNVLILRK